MPHNNHKNSLQMYHNSPRNKIFSNSSGNSNKWPTWGTVPFIYVFISILYVFQATLCSSSGQSVVPIQHLVYVTLCRWLFGMQVRKELCLKLVIYGNYTEMHGHQNIKN